MGFRSALPELGLNDEVAAFRRYYEDHGFHPTVLGAGEVVTEPIQRTIQASPQNRKAFMGFARKSLASQAAGEHPLSWMPPDVRKQLGIRKGALESGDISASVPLVYDPEIFGLLKTVAPLYSRVTHRGQRGFKAVWNVISARGGPVGFVSENDSLVLNDKTPSESTYAKKEKDMKIWTDFVQIGDFAQAGGEVQFNLSDTEMGQRLIVHGQEAEKAVLYGDTDVGKTDGSPLDTNAFDGLAEILADGGNEVDKSAVDITGTDAILKDIKKEIAALLQGANDVNPSDLEIWCSHTMFDELENELEVRRRIDQNVNSVNFGLETLRIKGIPVVASHNVKQHTWSGTSRGDDGDVFIMNRRATEMRMLAPLSTIPLARRGLSQETILFYFGTLIERSEGKFGKYLKAYAI